MFKVLSDKDFMQLLNLYIEMYKTIDPALSNSVVSIILAEELKKPGFIAFGVFQQDTLIGFLSGYQEKPNVFFNSGLYCSCKLQVKKLLEESEKALKCLGYESWVTEARGHIKSLAPKFGAYIELVRYRKEI